MPGREKILETMKKMASYILVAALASGLTWGLADRLPNSKLERLADIIDRKFIGQADGAALEDAAAEAMIEALDDRWSYYMTAQEYASHLDRQKNQYVGIGVTIQKRQDDGGFDILEVTAGGPAEEAGIQPGDILTHADGTFLGEMTTDQMRSLVMGEKNTKVQLTLQRAGKPLEFTVTRRAIHSPIAQGQLLSGNVGLVRIGNFYEPAGKETIEEIEKLLDQGADKLIFDLRDNPGGFVHEMVQVLDYLLPEGPLFRSVSYSGKESVEESGPDCLELPMAVLFNGNTYSAAEFFAAALSEYDWAVTLGEPTSGKGYYQTAQELGDGSAVALSTGKYTTPKGVNLTEAGGLVPDIPVEPGGLALTPEEDPQILAAIQALLDETK